MGPRLHVRESLRAAALGPPCGKMIFFGLPWEKEFKFGCAGLVSRREHVEIVPTPHTRNGQMCVPGAQSSSTPKSSLLELTASRCFILMRPRRSEHFYAFRFA